MSENRRCTSSNKYIKYFYKYIMKQYFESIRYITWWKFPLTSFIGIYTITSNKIKHKLVKQCAWSLFKVCLKQVNNQIERISNNILFLPSNPSWISFLYYSWSNGRAIYQCISFFKRIRLFPAVMEVVYPWSVVH